MGWAEGLLGGFTKRKGEYEAEERRSAELSSAREADFYKLLLEHGTPEFQSMAAAGLLSSAQAPQRKGGVRGWLGEMEANPMTAKIRELIGTPVTTEAPTMGLPSKQYTGYLSTPPSEEAPLAQPSTAATEVGAPPLAAINAAPQAGGQWQEEPAPITGSRTVSKPRQVLMSPEEAATATAAGQYGGRVQGIIQAIEKQSGRKLTPDEVKQIGLEVSGFSSGGAGGAGGVQSIPGEMPDGSPAFGVFDRVPNSPTYGQYIDPNTRRPLEGFRPRTTTGSTSLGQYAERAAGELGFRTAAAARAAGPDAMKRVNNRAAELAAEAAGGVTTARGEAGAAVPLNTQQRFQATTDLSKQWTTERTAGREMERQFSLMQTGITRYEADPIGASQAVLVTFQKILDPSSVVRESEYARSPQGLALMDRLQGMYERYSAGGAGVPKPVLEGMVETAKQLLAGVKGASDTVRQRIQDTATSYEIDPRLVLGADMPAAAVGVPPPGAALPAGGTGLDAPAPGVFLDAQGNIIRR